MARPVVVTSAPVAPEDDRHRRMTQYAVMMAIRFACCIAILFVEGWWQLVCLLGAVLLPYIAVTLANNAGAMRRAAPEAPGQHVLGPAPDRE